MSTDALSAIVYLHNFRIHKLIYTVIFGGIRPTAGRHELHFDVSSGRHFGRVRIVAILRGFNDDLRLHNDMRSTGLIVVLIVYLTAMVWRHVLLLFVHRSRRHWRWWALPWLWLFGDRCERRRFIVGVLLMVMMRFVAWTWRRRIARVAITARRFHALLPISWWRRCRYTICGLNVKRFKWLSQTHDVFCVLCEFVSNLIIKTNTHRNVLMVRAQRPARSGSTV